MKTLNKILGLFLIGSLLIFAGCEDVDKSYTGDAFVHFDNSAISIVESSTEIITVNILVADAPLAAPLNLTLDVDLTSQGVTQSCVQGVDFDILELTDLTNITIPAGSNSAEIQLVVHDNFDEDSAKYITLTLAGGGDFVMGYPGSELNKVIEIEITDDDCAFVPANFTGAPIGTDAFGWPSQVVVTEDTEWVGASATRSRHSVTGLIGGQFASWEETTTSGATFYLILDISDPLSPDVSIDLPVGETGHMIENDDGAWGYFVYDNESSFSTFSTCGRTLTWYYYIDLYQDQAIYGGGAGVQYWSTSLEVTFE